MRSRAEFGLLGPLEVRAEDEPLALGGAKQRALLALLLLNAGRVVARERLIDGLWGEEPPETAVKLVQLYVSGLRKVLPDGVIVTRAPGYLLEVDPDAVDLARFERLVAEARESEPRKAAALLREALGLWRGPALAEFGDESFFRSEAARLEELRLAAFEERIEADLALGREGELVGELEALVASEPRRERLRAQLMVALYRSGRHEEALEAYREARAALDEVGLEPGARLRELERLVLTQDAALDLSRERRLLSGPAPLPGPLVPEPAFPFVGRASERATLRGLLARAEAGEGGVVLLAGEAGGGKTRLIRELAQQAAVDGALVLYGGSDAAVTTPYQPLREWLEFLLRVCDPDALRDCLGAGGRELARLVPDLSRLTGAPETAVRDPESGRFALQAAVTDLLARASRGRPLLLVADDAHWADAESLHLLVRLARSAPEGRALLLVAFRERSEEMSGPFAARISDLARLEGVVRIALGGLDEDEVGEFIRGSAQVEAAGELVSTIRELTDGTPLLLCELWRELQENGSVEVAHIVRLTRPAVELRGPQPVQDVVRQRLSRLAPDTVSLLELAAVTGSRFDPRLLAAAQDAEVGALTAGLEDAVASGLVEELPSPALAHRFSHELLRRAIYDRLGGLRRVRLHLQVAEALERLHAADPDRVLPELAHHYTLAAPVAGAERAVDYNLRAAQAATAQAALAQAAAHLGSALELGIPDIHEQLGVQIERGWLLAETGNTHEARALLEDALSEATDHNEAALAAHARVLLAWSSWLGAPEVVRDDGPAIAEDAIAVFAETGDRRGLALARHLLAVYHRAMDQLASATFELEQALVDAEASAHAPTRSRVITQLVQVLCRGPEPVPVAIVRCEQLRDAARAEPVLHATIQRGLTYLYAMAARDDDACVADREANRVLDGLDHHTQVYFLLYSGYAQRLLGNTEAAEQCFLAVWRRFGGESGVRRTQTLEPARDLAHLCLEEDRWEDADRWLAWVEEDEEDEEDEEASLGVLAGRELRRSVKARLALHAGALDRALKLMRRAVAAVEPSDQLIWKAEVWRAFAEVLQAAGREDEAGDAIARTLDLYDQKGNIAAARALRARSRPVSRPSSTRMGT